MLKSSSPLTTARYGGQRIQFNYQSWERDIFWHATSATRQCDKFFYQNLISKQRIMENIRKIAEKFTLLQCRESRSDRIRNIFPDTELFPGSGTICFGSGSGENDEQINIFISNFRPLDSIRRD